MHPEWEGSDAQKQLKADMEAGLHEKLTPKELHEYPNCDMHLLFPLQVFP